MIPLQTPSGTVFLNELTNEILDEQALRSLARQYALQAGIDPDIFERQIEAESAFNPGAYNPSGATGIAQIVPRWHPGVDATDPVASLKYAANLMASHLRNYGGDYSLALAAYNAGPGAVAQYGGVPPYAETQNYIAKILGVGGGKVQASPQADPTVVDHGGQAVEAGLGSWSAASAAAAESSGLDISDPAFWVAINQAPPWIREGYPDFPSWQAAIGEQNATARAQSAADLAYKQAATNNLGASTAQSAFNNAANLAEQQRQFDENMGYEKAKYNTSFVEDQRQFNESQDLERGKALLNVGSRPDTLIRYLHALHGQLPPQGFGLKSPALPGFPGITAYPGSMPQGRSAPVAQTESSVPGFNPTDPTAAFRGALADPNADITPFFGDAAGGISRTAPQSLRAEDQALIAQGRKPKFYSDGVAIFKHGGPIPEHVIGFGLKSGKTYEFGEAGPEYVVPNNKLAELMGVIGKKGKEDADSVKLASGGLIGAQPDTTIIDQQIAAARAAGLPLTAGQQMYLNQRAAPAPSTTQAPTMGSPTTADKAIVNGIEYWAGGPYSSQRVDQTPANAGDLTPYLNNPSRPAPSMTGAAPQAAPQLGQAFAATPGPAPASLFNPGALAISSTIGGQFPQTSHFTGGGQSLIPSAQRFNQALPSERQFYSGFLTDEAGVRPEDVYDLASRLGPKVRGLSTPRYA